MNGSKHFGHGNSIDYLVRMDTFVGKYGVYLNFFRKVHRKNVPKNRKTDRKKISGEYLQEYERSPPNLKNDIPAWFFNTMFAYSSH